MSELYRITDLRLSLADMTKKPLFGAAPRLEILKGLSFEVPAGQQVAIVDPSGAGKSTIARLVFRFYDPWSGRILIDGQDIREVTQVSLRSAIGIVPQDSVLFNDTIGYNIAYGRDGAGLAEVEQAARDAALMGLIERLPQGFDTEVGERGVTLSGGQRQRIGIARALYKKARFLVFDEATSALDNKTESEIMNLLREFDEEYTVVVIAHRLTTLSHCERIYALESGKLRFIGNYGDLMNASDLGVSNNND